MTDGQSEAILPHIDSWWEAAKERDAEAVRHWKASDEGKAWRAEAIAEYFATLPPGDEGLVDAWLNGARFALLSPTAKGNIASGIAAVLDLQGRRDAEAGRLSPDDAAKLKTEAIAEYFAKLPPGDEGLVEAYWAAYEAKGKRLPPKIGWATRAEKIAAGIAAVLQLQRRRDEEAGWLSPSDAAGLRAHVEDRGRIIERLREDLAEAKEEPERLRRQVVSQQDTLDFTIAELDGARKEMADLRRDAERWDKVDAVAQWNGRDAEWVIDVADLAHEPSQPRDFADDVDQMIRVNYPAPQPSEPGAYDGYPAKQEPPADGTTPGQICREAIWSDKRWGLLTGDE